VYEALVKADLHAIHIPEVYGGAGADAISVAIVIEEASRLIGAEGEGEGFKIALRTLDHTRITIAAQALSIAQGALDYALGYVRERKQFGRPIAELQGLQFMIADMAMKLEAARQLTYAAAARSDRVMAGERVDDLTFFSSAGKCLASDVAMQVTTDARPAPRRLRLGERLPGRADDARRQRRQDHPDLRGDEPDPARGDGPPASQEVIVGR
jgi:alkylation response protein AidB-like acyl-CoA dehydrogenase